MPLCILLHAHQCVIPATCQLFGLKVLWSEFIEIKLHLSKACFSNMAKQRLTPDSCMVYSLTTVGVTGSRVSDEPLLISVIFIYGLLKTSHLLAWLDSLLVCCCSCFGAWLHVSLSLLCASYHTIIIQNVNQKKKNMNESDSDSKQKIL